MSQSSARRAEGGAPQEAGGGTDTIIIVSGFRPFQGGLTNPSLAVAARYAEGVKQRAGFKAVEVTLDVLWDKDQQRVRREIERVRKRWPGRAVEWVAFGQGRSFALETVARNRREAVADNAGRVPGGGEGHPGMENKPRGAERYVSDPADVRAVLQGLRRRGLTVSQSAEAGGFLCESVLYELLRQVQQGRLRRGRFFHVPGTEHMAGDDPERAKIEADCTRLAAVLSGMDTQRD